MNRDIEKRYIDAINAAAPDMDKFWEKIESGSPADGDTTPFALAAEETAAPAFAPTVKLLRRIGAAAAMLAAAVCLSMAIGSIQTNDIEEAADAPEINSAETVAAGDDVISDEIEEYESNAGGWNYRMEYTRTDSYESIDLTQTPSGVYTALSANTDDEEYFVESEVLKQTEFFVDGRIISAEKDGDCIIYEIKVIHLVADGEALPSFTVTAVSRSPYALRINREYLLPIREENGEYAIVFDNAPQIEIAADRTIIYHNGWKSLGSGDSISYPRIYEDDYFYDRMNITAEIALEGLFESWREANAS